MKESQRRLSALLILRSRRAETASGGGERGTNGVSWEFFVARRKPFLAIQIPAVKREIEGLIYLDFEMDYLFLPMSKRVEVYRHSVGDE
jgi:hypothetical protein